MQVQFEIEKLVPQFLLKDTEGYAMAKAVEAALDYMQAAVENSISCIFDEETMPEWRLDEMAWELNALYDYNADVEQKRKWIKSATGMDKRIGTPGSIAAYLEGIFDTIRITEWYDYAANPYHYKVTIGGSWTESTEAWVRAAIARAANVRSVLDSVTFSGDIANANNVKYGSAWTGADIYDSVDADM